MTHIMWSQTQGKRYGTTEPIAAYGQTIPAGFVFQVSVPNWMRWPIDPHDPDWLWASLWHDWALKQGWSKLRASALMARAQADSFRWWRWWWIPPTIAGTFVFTTLSPPLRRVFSWALGSRPRPDREG
ncbi:MAG: hypothetical protein AAF234_15910 [Pseudomonadota bacterium]